MPDVTIDWDFSDIMASIEKIGVDIEKVASPATKKAADYVAQEVKNNLNRSNRKTYSYPEEYIHMQDDVKVSNMIDEDDDKIRVIGGGKWTAYKWRFINDGTSNMEGNHFADCTKIETEDKVKEIILDEVRKVLPT